MLTVYVAHGHSPAAVGHASAVATRASAPTAPPRATALIRTAAICCLAPRGEFTPDNGRLHASEKVGGKEIDVPFGVHVLTPDYARVGRGERPAHRSCDASHQ